MDPLSMVMTEGTDLTNLEQQAMDEVAFTPSELGFSVMLTERVVERLIWPFWWQRLLRRVMNTLKHATARLGRTQ